MICKAKFFIRSNAVLCNGNDLTWLYVTDKFCTDSL